VPWLHRANIPALLARREPRALVPRRSGFDWFAAPWRTRTRALATRVWARRSSVDHRIAMPPGAIPSTGRRPIHPAWESISRRSPARAAALRVDVSAGPGCQGAWSTGPLHCGVY